MISHCGFDLHSPDDYLLMTIISCTGCPFIYLLWKNIYSDLVPIFKTQNQNSKEVLVGILELLNIDHRDKSSEDLPTCLEGKMLSLAI